LDSFWISPLRDRPNTKPGDCGTLNVRHRWFILFHNVWGPSWVEMHGNSIWLRARSHMTSQLHLGVRDHMTWFWRCVGMAFGRFLLGPHNFMVVTLGSCVKWPLVWVEISCGLDFSVAHIYSIVLALVNISRFIVPRILSKYVEQTNPHQFFTLEITLRRFTS
jgi:hypothetical protein